MGKSDKISDIISKKRQKVQNRFETVHQKILSSIEDYVTGGYINTLANLLVYLGKDRAETALQKLPDQVRDQVCEQYKNNSLKITDPKVIAEASFVMKKSGMYGKKLSDSVLKGLTLSETDILVESGDKYFEQAPILALNVEKNVIQFEDILEITDRCIQKILREVEQATLAKALKGADAQVQNKIFRNMSRRAAAMLKEDMEFLGPMKFCDVEAAREDVVAIIRRLQQSGDIVILDGDLVL